MQQQRLQQPKGCIDQGWIGCRGHAASAHLQAASGENTPPKRTMGGLPDHPIESLARAPYPWPERRDLNRAGTSLPDEDFEASSGLGAARWNEQRARSELRRAHQSIE